MMCNVGWTYETLWCVVVWCGGVENGCLCTFADVCAPQTFANVLLTVAKNTRQSNARLLFLCPLTGCSTTMPCVRAQTEHTDTLPEAEFTQQQPPKKNKTHKSMARNQWQAHGRNKQPAAKIIAVGMTRFLSTAPTQPQPPQA